MDNDLISLRQIKRMAILCPPVASGGPEALHQLGYAATQLGIDVSMIYVGGQNKVRVDPTILHSDAPDAPGVLEHYAEYAPKVSAQTPWGLETLAILPETMAKYYVFFAGGRVAVWWLSIDNAVEAWPELADPATRTKLFARTDIIHLYQSAYARDVLKDWGAPNITELRDYTRRQFADVMATAPSGDAACTYSGIKGGDLGGAFFAANPDLPAKPLIGIPRLELAKVLRDRLIYADFGHMPGQDRMPREAATCGSIVFVHRKGAGAYHEDFRLPEIFKFDLADIDNGSLSARIRAAIADPEGHWAIQQDFRDDIAGERVRFARQVAAVLDRPTA